MKKSEANKVAFTYQPKPFKLKVSEVAQDFVNLQNATGSDFKIADVIAQQSGIKDIEQRNIEAGVEEKVLERLKEVQEQAYKQAYDLGKVEGAEKAFEERRSDFLAQLASFDQFLRAVDDITKSVAKEAESTIIKLVFQVAQRIAMRAINLEQEPILTLVSELVNEVQGAESITVKLSVADAQFVEDLRKKGVKEAELLQRVKIQSSEDIKGGGCIVETNFGAIDATVEQRVQKAWSILEAKLPVVKRDAGAS